MTRFLSIVCLAAAAISAVSAAAVSSIVPTTVVSETALYTAAPVAVSNSTLEDRSTIEARASGGFVNSCSSWGGTYGTIGGKYVATLQATCRTKSGASKTTSLDLNRCFVNDFGSVRCQTNGGFLGSCQPVNSPKTGDQWLRVICGNGQGGYSRPSIDLNSCIGNSDGNLVC